MLTLRQIEVIRAVEMAGTIAGAAELLNVSAPGLSRLIKNTEDTLGFKLFQRRSGTFIPAIEARAVFDQINIVFDRFEALEGALLDLRSGRENHLAFASVPSLSEYVVPRAIKDVRKAFPSLYIDLNIIKIEEAVDYLLLERGEFVAMSYSFENPAVEFTLLREGALVAVVPTGHPLAGRSLVEAAELVQWPIIGVDRRDPYGEITARPFVEAGVDAPLSIQARYVQTVVNLVRQDLGVAIIDEFAAMSPRLADVVAIPLSTACVHRAYAAMKKGRTLSSYAEFTIAAVKAAAQGENAAPKAAGKTPRKN